MMHQSGLVRIVGVDGEHRVLENLGYDWGYYAHAMIAYVNGREVTILAEDPRTGPWRMAPRIPTRRSWLAMALYAALFIFCIGLLLYVTVLALTGCQSWDSEMWTTTSSCISPFVGPWTK